MRRGEREIERKEKEREKRGADGCIYSKPGKTSRVIEKAIHASRLIKKGFFSWYDVCIDWTVEYKGHRKRDC